MRESKKFTDAPSKDRSQTLCACMLLTCSGAYQAREALELLRLTGHKLVFFRVADPGAKDAGGAGTTTGNYCED